MIPSLEGNQTELYEWFGTTRLEFIERDDTRSAICHRCKRGLHDYNFYTILEWGYCSNKCAKRQLKDIKDDYFLRLGEQLRGIMIRHYVMVNSDKLGADKVPNYILSRVPKTLRGSSP